MTFLECSSNTLSTMGLSERTDGPHSQLITLHAAACNTARLLICSLIWMTHLCCLDSHISSSIDVNSEGNPGSTKLHKPLDYSYQNSDIIFCILYLHTSTGLKTVTRYHCNSNKMKLLSYQLCMENKWYLSQYLIYSCNVFAEWSLTDIRYLW